MRISSPPIKWPCFYGIDMPDRDELIASHLDVDSIRSHLSADSLAFLSLQGMVEATRLPQESFCTACFSSRYPVPIPPAELRNKQVLEPQGV